MTRLRRWRLGSRTRLAVRFLMGFSHSCFANTFDVCDGGVVGDAAFVPVPAGFHVCALIPCCSCRWQRIVTPPILYDGMTFRMRKTRIQPNFIRVTATSPSSSPATRVHFFVCLLSSRRRTLQVGVEAKGSWTWVTFASVFHTTLPFFSLFFLFLLSRCVNQLDYKPTSTRQQTTKPTLTTPNSSTTTMV
jgi:hypothetical protein